MGLIYDKKLIIVFAFIISCFAFIISCILTWGTDSNNVNSKIEINDIDLVYCIVNKDKSKGIISFVLANDLTASIYKKVWQSTDGAVHVELFKYGIESEQMYKEKIPGLVYGIRNGSDITYSRVDGYSFTFELDPSRPCEELYIGSKKMPSVNLLWNTPNFKDEFIMSDIEGFDD